MYFQEESKAIADQDPDKIRNLEQMKKDYEEKIKSIKDAMSSGTEIERDTNGDLRIEEEEK